MRLPKIDLMPVPDSEWLGAWVTVCDDPFIKLKYNRDRRIREKFAYIQAYCAGIISNTWGAVLDIGPGPGEFLELARHWGHPIRGVDAAMPEGGMGEAYLELSFLMHIRQQLTVDRCGLLPALARDAWLPPDCCVLINSQGSIEQSFAEFMDGPPHDQHHDCGQLAWRMGPALTEAFDLFFSRCREWLVTDGQLLVYANGSANTAEWSAEFRRVAERHGFILTLNEVCGRLLRWRNA